MYKRLATPTKAEPHNKGHVCSLMQDEVRCPHLEVIFGIQECLPYPW